MCPFFLIKPTSLAKLVKRLPSKQNIIGSIPVRCFSLYLFLNKKYFSNKQKKKIKKK